MKGLNRLMISSSSQHGSRLSWSTLKTSVAGSTHHSRHLCKTYSYISTNMMSWHILVMTCRNSLGDSGVGTKRILTHPLYTERGLAPLWMAWYECLSYVNGRSMEIHHQESCKMTCVFICPYNWKHFIRHTVANY